MKKVLSVFVAIFVLMSAMGVVADEPDFYEIFNNKDMLNGEISFEASIKLNESLPSLPGIEQETIDQIENSKFLVSGSFDMSEDFRRVKMDLAIDVDIMGESRNIRAWYDLDVTDTEKPKYFIVMKMPDEEKFMYADYADMFLTTTGTDFASLIDPSLSIEISEEILKQTDVSEVKKEVSDNKYTLTIPQSTVLSYLKATAKSYCELVARYFMVAVEGAASEEQYVNAIDEFFAKLEDIKLFAEDAVTIEVTLDDNQNIKTEDIVINIQTDAKDIIDAFDIQDVELAGESLNIDLTLSLHYTFDKVNEGVEIEFPVLTEENSINLLEYGAMQSTEPVIVVFVNDNLLTSDVPPYIKDGRTMVPLRAICEALNVPEEDIGFNEGVISITAGSNEMSFTAGSNTAYVNGAEVILDVPAEIVNGRTLVPVRFFSEALGFDVDWVEFEGAKGGIVAITGELK